MADTLVAKDPSTGKSMLDLGYSWVVLDDCWHPSRDANGTLVPFPRFFPHGMQPVIEYVHSLGLTFGLYTSVGDVTCHGGWSPGSLGHWQQDADTFAAWGVDCTPLLPLRPPLLAARGSDGLRFVLSDVKIDYCGNGTDPSGHHAMSQVIRLLHTHETVARGSEHRTVLPVGLTPGVRNAWQAMNATGRPMVLALCRGPYQREENWGYARDVAQVWRAAGRA
eukprot:COSAG04_NODE_111_length_25781_cov_90.291761_9_plen_222_part_00